MIILWKTETTSLVFAELTVPYWKYQFFEIFNYYWLILFDDIQLGEQHFVKWVQILFIEAERRIYATVNMPTLVQKVACRLIGAKPLSEPMLEYY